MVEARTVRGGIDDVCVGLRARADSATVFADNSASPTRHEPATIADAARDHTDGCVDTCVPIECHAAITR